MTTLSQGVLAAYGAAWGETDHARRLELLDIAWSDDGVYRDPTGEAKGREGLARHIGDLLAKMPGARIELTSGVSAHHDHIYFSWRLIAASGEVATEGVDFGTLDSDGRLLQIVGFFGAPPSL